MPGGLRRPGRHHRQWPGAQLLWHEAEDEAEARGQSEDSGHRLFPDLRGPPVHRGQLQGPGRPEPGTQAERPRVDHSQV